MATQEFFAQRNVGPGGYTSPQITLPAGTIDIEAQIVSADWDTTTGTWSWRVELLAGGVWQHWIGQEDQEIGQRGKNGEMPTIGISESDAAGNPVNLGGRVIRIFMRCDPRIRIGCSGTLTTL